MVKNILVTGVSGSGKSTVAEMLQKRGHHVVDMDYELCTMLYRDTKEPVMTEFQNHDLAWVKSVEWICDKNKLKALLAKPGRIFCCGAATNIEEFLPLFDIVVLLQIEGEPLRHRLTHRTNNNWGQEKDVQDWVLLDKKEFEQKVLNHHPVCIDAHRNIHAVVDDILKLVD